MIFKFSRYFISGIGGGVNLKFSFLRSLKLFWPISSNKIPPKRLKLLHEALKLSLTKTFLFRKLFFSVRLLWFRKPHSKTITVVFKILIHQTESCNDQLQYVSGIINFRTLNDQPVIKGVDSINRRTKTALNLSSDFSNLHANIPKLFKVLCELLERKRDFITIYKYGTRWTKQDKEYLPKFSNATLEQSFLKFRKQLFQQLIGVPVVSDSPHFVTNLY